MAKKVTIKIPADPFVLGYLAGIIDGEGCIYIRPHYKKQKGSTNPSLNSKVAIGNTDVRLMLWLVENIGGTFHQKHGKHQSMRHWKPAHDWIVNGNNAAQLLKAIRPYMVIKGEQADVLLALAALKEKRSRPLTAEHVAQAQALREKMGLLNQRGIKVVK
jgi:hypothetical protein